MMYHRLCLGCLEDWTGSKNPLCPACQLEHDVRKNAKDDGRRNTDDVEWWGPTIDEVDAEDLDGFYVASAEGGDTPLYRSADYG